MNIHTNADVTNKTELIHEKEQALLKEKILLLTTELIKQCPYQVHISSDPNFETPIYCSKFTSRLTPLNLNVETCLSCGEYKRTSS